VTELPLSDVRVLDLTRLLPGGFWWRFDEERRRQTGGSAEQYKHPCLVTDLTFAERLMAGREPVGAPTRAWSA